MTSWICMKLQENIFRDTNFKNCHPIGPDKVVISWFMTFEILWITRVMWKSNNLWWRYFRLIMIPVDNFHFPSKFLNFDHPEFLWTLVPEAYFSIFKVEKINQKLPKFITHRVFLDKPTTLNLMSISVFAPAKVGRFSILIM